MFDSSLRESPQHVRAYLEMTSVWEEVPELDPSWNPTAEELIERARREANIHPLQVPGDSTGSRKASRDSTPPPPVKEIRWRRALSSLAATSLVAVGVATAWYWLDHDTYSTGIGEQRSLVLDDGSTIELNAQSKIRVRFTEQRRGIELVRGQALFRVAHNTARPFIVHSGNTDVRAVGTQFDVYERRDGTVVTVIEGKVSSTPHDRATADGSNAILIAAGEQLVIPAAAPRTEKPITVENPRRADVEAATAWTNRTLVFDASPLTEVAEEFNRYNSRQLVITDAALGDLRISGIFSSVDPALLLKFLRAQPELDVDETAEEIRVSKR